MNDTSSDYDSRGDAGFEVVPVRAGLLYELVPPGREPYMQNAG